MAERYLGSDLVSAAQIVWSVRGEMENRKARKEAEEVG